MEDKVDDKKKLNQFMYSKSKDELYCIHNVGHSDRPHVCDDCCKKRAWKNQWQEILNAREWLQ